MEVHKFGGASIKDSDSIINVCKIIRDKVKYGVVVVSAMGKSTNDLEQIAYKYYKGEDFASLFDKFIVKNTQILAQLLSREHVVVQEVEALYVGLRKKLAVESSENFDFEYDQIVSYGELISATILRSYLQYIGVEVIYDCAFNLIKTDSVYREANVDWQATTPKVTDRFTDESKLYLTQGFIGSDKNNLPVTLGREGSDYSAAILGSILCSKKVTVWKDVPGVMCADPNWIPDCDVLATLSYHEIIELSYFGAKVIHPKTIKPLQNKEIPLLVRSFVDLDAAGTIIGDFEPENMPPVFVRKEHQVLITIWQSDFSFIVEQNLSHIFGVLAAYQIKVNIMQNSAISFSVCVDGDQEKILSSIETLRESYHVKYNDGLELLSIRHTIPGIEEKLIKNKKVLLEQKSRSMARFLVRAN